jgi:hypothetical protein
MDTQAIGGWNRPGPYTLENPYLEAAGKKVMFGGSDSKIPELVPEGITIKRNVLSKPEAWRNPIVSPPRKVAAKATGGGRNARPGHLCI